VARGRPKQSETKAKKNGNGANVGFEAELFLAADKLRKNLEPSDYKHVVLGLIFLRHISQAFEAKREALLAEDASAAEDPDEYLAENIFWVPKDARWSQLQANARQPTIGKMVDDAMLAIETANPSLKGVLPKDYNRPALDKIMVGELIDLISGISWGAEGEQARDLLGRVYEYFLGGFAGSEGKRGGEFYTPRSVVRVLVEMLEPFPDKKRGIEGRVYDPCCGSGGMFVQAERFLEAHGGRIGELAIYGQESNYTTWRLCKMNLAVRGIDADIRWNNEGSFHRDELKDRRFDFILANPPFNISDWGGERLREDARWKYGVPPVGNANYAWLLLPGQLFYSTQIPACLWFLARNKGNGRFRDRRGEVLFIDARKLGHMVDRTRKEFSEEDISSIAGAYHAWRGEKDAGNYKDIPGFCKAAQLEEVKAHGYVLSPGRYVGTAEAEEDDTPFPERLAVLSGKLEKLFGEGERLTATIKTSLERISTHE
jgi:type I restriction enzyme M protein